MHLLLFLRLFSSVNYVLPVKHFLVILVQLQFRKKNKNYCVDSRKQRKMILIFLQYLWSLPFDFWAALLRLFLITFAVHVSFFFILKYVVKYISLLD